MLVYIAVFREFFMFIKRCIMKENRELDEFEEEYGGGTKNGEHHVNKM